MVALFDSLTFVHKMLISMEKSFRTLEKVREENSEKTKLKLM